MGKLLFYPVGCTPACHGAAKALAQAGVEIADHITPEATHLLMDVPSFSGAGVLKSGAKLEELLSRVEGVGEVRVVLMTGVEKDSSSFYNSGQETVTGVLVAAQGADNSVVSRNIVEAVMALFQVEAHKIKVMKMK